MHHLLVLRLLHWLSYYGYRIRWEQPLCAPYSLFTVFVPFALLRWRKDARKYRAPAAYLHLILPALLRGAFTDGPVDEPAQMSCLQLPCRALQPDLLGASLPDPTWSGSIGLKGFERHKKEHLALDMHRDAPPSLLQALYGFWRRTQYLGHLLLRFSEKMTDLGKLCLVHAALPTGSSISSLFETHRLLV
jgi:hypothetical protein